MAYSDKRPLPTPPLAGPSCCGGPARGPSASGLSSSAYTWLLELLAAALAPTTSALSVTQQKVDHVHDNAALVDDAVLEWTGDERRQVQCVIHDSRVPSDTLLVDQKNFSAVVLGFAAQNIHEHLASGRPLGSRPKASSDQTPAWVRPRTERSEEHTSELQSHS